MAYPSRDGIVQHNLNHDWGKQGEYLTVVFHL